jgi:hypothetical protein
MEAETRYLYRCSRSYEGKPLEFDAFPIIRETAAQYVIEMTNHFSQKFEKRINKGRMIMDYEKWFPSPEAGARWFLEAKEKRLLERQSAAAEIEERVESMRRHVAEAVERATKERDEFKATNAALLRADG